MKYVIIAILLYLAYLFIRRIIANVSAANEVKKKSENNGRQKKTYDVNMIQDAEFREVKKD
ncbi:MAG TPA: hypothetical protein PK605_11545 [Ignavibacteria bacterium]|nr:hypothetical protein [Bacteroidota bacterium]HRE09486.1 hypothetical protein [Ignavibacteria bacterium]HRF64610.1 hypothetical protein [Ignavibacteria bacterium]HRJ05027.1 hypothetical protein [Ignavibacteria bacterium]HRJ85301.1 hypothetical protein [Ignavibacteria bacterium]